MLAREVRLLFRKELSQLLRNRGAMLSALFLPLLMILLMPLAQIFSMSSAHPRDLHLPPEVPLPPGLAELRSDPRAFLWFIMTPLIATGCLLCPAVTASYIFLAERESRTLELLVALPVRVGQILQAKLLAILVLAIPVCLGFYGVNAGLLLTRGLGSPSYVLMLGVMLLCALACSTSTALLVSLLARDFRSASNLNGLVLGPLILGSFTLMAAMPGPTLAAGVLALLYTAVAVGTTLLAMRVVTFERLLR
ncbi:ABC transporter permease subunit [Hyalangium versicolor]|uniref:ABC transporter permease subunit n=1 Tax=Hyalangium versicolor TaxID=2861190 RepID=UPI001CCFDA53|nr:ABC transporter permease subunit [Hyalangium versicolor]